MSENKLLNKTHLFYEPSAASNQTIICRLYNQLEEVKQKKAIISP